MQVYKTHTLTLSEVTITVEVESEDLPVRGNYMCSGDDAADKRDEDEVIGYLDRGFLEAWCVLKVTAEWKTYRGVAYLGGCSFLPPHNNQSDFEEIAKEHDMADQALADLNAKVAAIVEELSPLIET